MVDARRSEVFAARYRFDGTAASAWDPAGHEVRRSIARGRVRAPRARWLD